jgi:[acyl-carrier-protein] S-malonyltransferase
MDQQAGARHAPRWAVAVIAFVYPGQGAQYIGMGVELADRYACARRVFKEASVAIDVDLLELCRAGPEEHLRATENTQPAILTCSTAVTAVLAEHDVQPHVVAGLSLGEYSALVAAGAMSLADAARVVRQRGRFMQEAADRYETAMAAILGLDGDTVVEVCRTTPGLVEAANFNAPGQVVIAGDVEAVEAACHRLRAAGAKRAVRLAVSAPFHTSLMRSAAEALAPVLRATTIVAPTIPVVCNVTAAPVQDAEAIHTGLVQQVTSPVRWEQSMRALHALGASVFVEAGPGTTLAGLVRRTVQGATVVSVENQATLESALSILKTAASGNAGVVESRA